MTKFRVTLMTSVLLLPLGCGSESDAGGAVPGGGGVLSTGGNSGATNTGGKAGALGSGGAAGAGGATGSVPGGPPLTAPIVGCKDAERPARRLPDAAELCESKTRCWYVSPEGSDSGAGTFSSPYKTPQNAVRQAGPGDIIYLRGGEYTEANAYTGGKRPNLVRVGHAQLTSGKTYDVASGTEAAPIIVRSFPGERACSAGAGFISVGSLGSESAWWRFENLTLREAGIFIGGGSSAETQTHDIVIVNNEVYGLAIAGGDNPGLIRINRGDFGGPTRISVESNILHDLVPIDNSVVGSWDTTADAQHFGAVTTISCEEYLGIECGGTGSVQIRNNHIYRVPQAFFFKNPSAGPYQIDGNVIHHTQRLGGWVASNITFENNLIYEASGIGFGTGANYSGELFERAGHSLTVRNNTFVGLNALVSFKSYATGHTVRGNIIQGLELSLTKDKTWDNVGYIAETIGSEITDVTKSQLASGNDFDDNCFVTSTEDFIAYGRRYSGGGGGLDHLSLTQTRDMLGYELTSLVVTNPQNVFENFKNGDYRTSNGGACGTRGAAVPPWANGL